MEFNTDNKGLTLTVTKDEQAELEILLGEVGDHFYSDANMFEWFADILGNCEYEWISAERIGALTGAPILAILDADDNVLEAYGWMQYAVISLLDELMSTGKAFLQRG